LETSRTWKAEHRATLMGLDVTAGHAGIYVWDREFLWLLESVREHGSGCVLWAWR
jgi:hypothetical protein